MDLPHQFEPIHLRQADIRYDTIEFTRARGFQEALCRWMSNYPKPGGRELKEKSLSLALVVLNYGDHSGLSWTRVCKMGTD